MACKKPVLITKNINIWSEIIKGDGGWIANLEEKNSLKNVLSDLLNHPKEELLVKGSNAFETYQNNFKIETCANNFIKTLISI
ncbi:glycosyltransferase [Flavobacterium sp. LBUM151]